MKKLLTFVFLLNVLFSFSQSQIRAKQVIADNSMYLKNWITAFEKDTSLYSDSNVLTGLATVKLINGRTVSIGNTLKDQSYKAFLIRRPYMYGDSLFSIGNSWANGSFATGTHWFQQLCTFYNKIRVTYAVNGDDCRSMVNQAFAHISGADDPHIYFADIAWVDILSVTPASAGSADTWGYNDAVKNYKKVVGTTKAILANSYLKEWHSFEDLGTDGSNFTAQATTDSTKSKSANNSKHVMKGQGNYSFVKPAGSQSLVIGYLNTDGIYQVGGTINVYVRGVLFKSVNTNECNNAGGGATKVLYNGLSYDAIIMQNMTTDTASVRVETVTNNVWLDYYGYMVEAKETQKPFYINNLPYLLGSFLTVSDFGGPRMYAMVDTFNLARREAIRFFENYPVFTADANSVIDNSAYIDINVSLHLGATGNNKIANIYKNNLTSTFPQSGSVSIPTSPGGADGDLQIKNGNAFVGGGPSWDFTDKISWNGGSLRFVTSTYARMNPPNGTLQIYNPLASGLLQIFNSAGSDAINVDATTKSVYGNSALTLAASGANTLKIQTNSIDRLAIDANGDWLINTNGFNAGMGSSIKFHFKGGSNGGFDFIDDFNGGGFRLRNIGGTTTAYFTDFSNVPINIAANGFNNPFDGTSFLFAAGYYKISAGNFGIGVTPTTYLDINGNKFRVRTAKTPSSAADTGDQGDICWDANFIYVCVAANTWVRAPLATW